MNKLMLSAFMAVTLMSPVAAIAADVDVKQVFRFYCAQCHGLEGNGDGPNVTEDFPVTPRKFNDAAEMSKLSDADIRNVILDGGPAVSKSEMMPPWSETLADAEVDALIIYLRELCNCAGP